MATEYVLPDTLAVNTFNAGGIGDVDEGITEPPGPDANWLTVAGTADDPTCRATFNPIVGAITELNGTQTFRVYVRKHDATGGGDPTIAVDLYEAGSLITADIINTTVPDNTTGATLSGTWDPATSTLSDTTGADVEMFVTITSAGGGPNQRTGELGALEWEAQYNERRIFYYM